MKKLLLICSIFLTTTTALAEVHVSGYLRAIIGSAGDERVDACSPNAIDLGIFTLHENGYTLVSQTGATLSGLKKQLCGEKNGPLLACYTQVEQEEVSTDFTMPIEPPSFNHTRHETIVLCGEKFQETVHTMIDFMIDALVAQ